MARLPRCCPAGLPQHIIQRGNNSHICFAGTQDFAAYANWLKEYSEKFAVSRSRGRRSHFLITHASFTSIL